MFKKVKRYIKSPYYALGDDLLKIRPRWMSDKFFLRVLWKQIMGDKLDLKHPMTFNEKIQWTKLYDRNPLYTILVDKYKVKQWVSERIGDEYVIPTLAVFKSVDEIDISALPEQFVLKCNHDSGGIVICRDRDCFDLETAKQKLRESLKKNYYWDYREWAYKDVKRVIIAEPYLEDQQTGELLDYKFFTFNGTPKLMFVASGRQSGKEVRFDFFSMSYEWMRIKNVHPNSTEESLPKRPECFSQMISLARVLSEGLNEVRIDFYEVNGRCYFGEMTIYHGAGFMPFSPHSVDCQMGEWFHLSTQG